MTSNAKNPSLSKSALQRKNVRDPGPEADKENVGPEKEKHTREASTVSRKLLIPSESSSAKTTKCLSNGKDQALRPKGLQEVGQSKNQGAIPKNRSQLTNETSKPKPFVYKSFSIYDESKGDTSKNSESKLRTKRLTYRKAPKLRMSPVGFEQPVSTAVPNNIKQIHRQKDIQKKQITPNDVSNILSIEAAYNLEYMSEYLRFQMEINEKRMLSQNFLKYITPDQRRLIVKYLIDSTTYHKYPSFVLHQAVKIFDFYVDTVDVPVKKLQIAALAALWIALKKDLTTGEIPEASDIIKLGGSSFKGDKKPLIECEKNILMSLNFEVSFPDPFSILALYTATIDQVRTLELSKVKELYYCGCYLLDLSLLQEKIMTISTMQLAAITTEIALVVCISSDENLMTDPQWSYWRSQVHEATPILKKYCLPESQMNDIRNVLLRKAMQSDKASTDYNVVYKKYSSKRYGPVSKFLLSKISSLYTDEIVSAAYASKSIFI